jgi:hypothetical protein
MAKQRPTVEPETRQGTRALHLRVALALAIACAGGLSVLGCSSDSCSDACRRGEAAGQGGASGGGGGASGGAAGVGASGAGAGGAGGAAAAVDQTIPEGACVPEGPSFDRLGAARSVVYSGPRALGAIAVRRENVLVADAEAGLLRIASGTTTFERVVTASVSEFLAADLNLYWYEDRAIWRASLSATDATPDPVAQNLSGVMSVRAFDETNLYVLDPSAHTIVRLPIAGGAAANLASGVDVDDLELHAGFVYYADRTSRHVLRVSVDGGESERLTTSAGRALATVATDGTTVHWSDGIAIFATSIEDGSDHTAIGVAGPAAGGGRSAVQRMRRSDDRLYWSDAANNIGWTAVDGSACALIVAGVPDLRGWDVDELAVYTTSSKDSANRELWRIEL